MTEHEHIIEIRGLWTQFGDFVVHRGIDLDVRRGEILSLVGGSGSGKTTMLRQMLGLERPTRGEVRVFGTSLHGSEATALRRLRNRIDADLRVVPAESFGAALGYFTGSKDHNVALRQIAQELGLTELYLKDDSINHPTLSYKDRVVSVAATRALELGMGIFGCASTGNLGNSVAAHAARSGGPARKAERTLRFAIGMALFAAAGQNLHVTGRDPGSLHVTWRFRRWDYQVHNGVVWKELQRRFERLWVAACIPMVGP